MLPDVVVPDVVPPVFPEAIEAGVVVPLLRLPEPPQPIMGRATSRADAVSAKAVWFIRAPVQQKQNKERAEQRRRHGPQG